MEKYLREPDSGQLLALVEQELAFLEPFAFELPNDCRLMKFAGALLVLQEYLSEELAKRDCS